MTLLRICKFQIQTSLVTSLTCTALKERCHCADYGDDCCHDKWVIEIDETKTYSIFYREKNEAFDVFAKLSDLIDLQDVNIGSGYIKQNL